MSRVVLLALLATGCASGPRPVPRGATPAERLAFAEEVTLQARGVATFELDATGPQPAHFTGTLQLTGTNGLVLTADGRLGRDTVHLDLDSRQGDINRTVTRGNTASAQRNAPQPALHEALVVGLVRMGLLHNLVRLSGEQMVMNAEGGVRGQVVPLEVRDAGPDASGAEPCTRLEFQLQVGGTVTGDTSLCVSDATGLPLQRRVTVHFPEGDLTDVERFTWKLGE